MHAIYTVHVWTFLEARPAWQLFLIRLFSRITCALYDRVIVISTADKNAALGKRIVRNAKLAFIPNGIGPVALLPRAEAIQMLFGDSEERIVIGTIGEWTANKNTLLLLEVLPDLLSHFPAIHLCLIGWGEQEPLRAYIREHNLKRSVTVRDDISPAAPVLSAFDIFSLPSLKEGLPYVILEAGLAGLPTVASSVGGVPDIIHNGENGILVMRGAHAEFSQALTELLGSSELRTRLGNALKATVEEKFSLDRMVALTRELYASFSKEGKHRQQTHPHQHS